MRWLALLLVATPAFAVEAKPCLKEAVALLRADANGMSVFRASEPEQFSFWLDCDGMDYDVSSAVHESVHLLSQAEDTSRYRYLLVGGDTIEVPWTHSPDRSKIVRQLRKDEKDGYVETYLTGSSGQQGLELVMDELNAYTHGLVTEVALAPRNEGTGRRTGARDGVAHFQLYLSLYLRMLKHENPQMYREMSATHGQAVATLWKQAERALTDSLPFRSLGIDDRWYLFRAYHPDQLEQLDDFVGKRVWSTSLQNIFITGAPKGPNPPDKKDGDATERRQQQKQVRATVSIGPVTYAFEELWPGGEVTLVVDGKAQAAIKNWDDLVASDVPREVIDLLQPSHDQLHAD